MIYEEDFSAMANESLIRTITGTEVNEVESLETLSNMTQDELAQIKGLGKKTAKKLLAAFELGRRLLSERNHNKHLGTSLDLYNHLYPVLGKLDHEEIYVVIMNQQFNEIKTVRLSTGGWTESAMDIRAILREALINKGTIIAVAHNHPSGNPAPSKNDDALTSALEKAARTMRIFFMDHIIIGDNAYYSYHDKGKL